MRRLLLTLLLSGLLPVSADAFRVRGSNVAVVPPPAQSIVSITPAAASFVGGTGSANRTAFVVTVNMSAGPPFAGSLSLIGPDAGMFKLVGNTVTACAPPQTPCGDVAAASYNISVVADQPGATGSPATQPVAVTATVPGSATFITTATFQNITGTAGQPAPQTVTNWPLQRAQAFKFGEVPPSSHVEIRTASGSTCNGTLLEYQWDDIATRVENTGDGSWRTATFTVRLPAAPAGAYVTLAFCKAAGAYSVTPSSISLPDLVTAHPLAMDFTDVANQDGSTRNTGSATMAIANYIATTGREAPTLTADGPIRKSWKIRGEPVYATSGLKDPLLYVEWYIDVFPNPSNPSQIQYVRHLTRVLNAWMQVAAGTAGTAGATDCNGGPCPVGFTNDPQMVSYKPLVRDGATALVDYGAIFDNTVADSTLPSNTKIYQTNAGTSAGGNVLRFQDDALGGGQPPLQGVWYHARVSNVDHPTSIPTGCQVVNPDIGISGYQLDCTIASPGVSSGDHIKFETYFTKPDNILGPFSISAMSWASSFGGELTLITSNTGITTGSNTRLMIVGATNTGTGGSAAINTVFTEWEGNNDGTHWGLQAEAAAGVFGTLGFGSAQVYIAAPGKFVDDDQKTGYFQSNASSGSHLYYPGSCFRYTTGGTAPHPMVSGKIYYPYTINFFKQPANGDRFQLTEMPINQLPITPLDVGSGSQTLSYRVCHRRQTGWFTANPEGKSRWVGAAFETEPFETTLDQNAPFTTERAYFQSSGVIPPLELSHAANWASTTFSEVEYSASTSQYYPCSVSLAIGGSGGGSHGYIGIMNEWNARWWMSQSLAQIKQTRIFALDGECYPQTVILNEQTGRIPVINNGAPVGTGTGTGTQTYAGLGTAVYPHLNIPLNGFGASAYVDVTYPLTGIPKVSGGDPIKPLLGPYQGGIYNDHQPAWAYMPPFLFGDRHYKDIVWDQGNRTGYIATDRSPNNANEGGPNRNFTFPSGSGTPPAGQTFHGVLTFGNIDQQGPRGGAWMQRAVTMAAAIGADGGSERNYFYDLTKENYNFWRAMKAHKDCSSPQDSATSPYTAVPGGWSNSPAATVEASSNQAFMNMYNSMARYIGWQLLRDPYSREQLDGAFFQNVKASLGTDGWPNSTPPSMSAGFYYYQWGNLGKAAAGKCRAPYAGTYLDYGSSSIFVGIDVSNGIWMMAGNSDGLLGPVGVTMTPGDKVKNVHIGDQSQLYVETATTGGSPAITNWGPNEMPLDQYYCLVNINNTDRTFRVAPPAPDCNTPGAAITSYTGLVEEGQNYCYAPPAWSAGELPPSMNIATTFFCGFAFNFRTQANNFIGNPGYVYWNGSMAAAVASSGVPAAVASYNISRAYMPVTDILSNSVGSAFDWGVTTIPP